MALAKWKCSWLFNFALKWIIMLCLWLTNRTEFLETLIQQFFFLIYAEIFFLFALQCLFWNVKLIICFAMWNRSFALKCLLWNVKWMICSKLWNGSFALIYIVSFLSLLPRNFTQLVSLPVVSCSYFLYFIFFLWGKKGRLELDFWPCISLYLLPCCNCLINNLCEYYLFLSLEQLCCSFLFWFFFYWV